MDEIVDDFKQFNITPDKFPPYENPYQFTKTFDICSVQEYMNVSISSTTTEIDKTEKKVK